MHSIIRALLVICFSGNLLSLFAQNDTPRSGFAVVTVVSGNIAGIAMTEALRNTNGATTEQSNVAPTPLITTASILVNVAPSAGNNTAIALSNPSLVSGAVNLVLTNALGVPVLNTIVRLSPRGQFSKFLSELFPTQPVEFSSPLLLTMVSEIPVAVLALNFRGADFAALPLTSLSTAFPVPAQPLIPTVSAPPGAIVTIGGGNSQVFTTVTTGGGWSTDLTVGNTSTAPQIIRIDFFQSNGLNAGSLTDIVIPSRGVFFFSTQTAATPVL
jgi:hypothetical protein